MSEVTVKANSKQGYKQQIQAGPFALVADVPKTSGGEESAPNPHELLLSALGSCTSVTVQMYAKRKEWDLQEIEVKLTDEMVEDPSGQGKIPKITRAVTLKGNLTDEQVEQLRAVADKCAIHKLITGPKQVITEVKLAQHVAS